MTTYDVVMVFRMPIGDCASDAGQIDYRLARVAMLNEWRAGVISRSDVCDAHPELVRAARELGTPLPGECPICSGDEMVHVTYVFGPRLPSHGRCISLPGELSRYAQRPGTHVAYVVEVCRACSWNHLLRRSTLGDAEAASS